MDEQRHDASAKAEPAASSAWDSVRRFREPAAWALLAFTAVTVLTSICQLFRLAGATIPVVTPVSVTPVPVGSGRLPVPTPLLVSAFSLRASAVTPQFIGSLVIGLPVLAVVLVVFSGGRTERARQVVRTAAAVQAAAFLFGVISAAGAAASHTRPGTWFVLVAADLGIAATALVFTGVATLSPELRSAAPRYQELADDDENLDDA